MTEAVVYRLGWALVHFVWQGTAVALVLLAALAALRRRSANARYLAAFVAMLTLAVAPVLTFALIEPSPAPESVTALAPATVPGAPTPPAEPGPVAAMNDKP